MSALVDALQKGQVAGDGTCGGAGWTGGRQPDSAARRAPGVADPQQRRIAAQPFPFAGMHSHRFLELDGTRVFVERFGAVPQIVVCGGGHVAASVVRLAKLLGLPVLAMEDRTEYAQDLRDAGADTVLCLPFAQALEQCPAGQRPTLWS
mgnify:CR=1 FL=1